MRYHLQHAIARSLKTQKKVAVQKRLPNVLLRQIALVAQVSMLMKVAIMQKPIQLKLLSNLSSRIKNKRLPFGSRFC